MVVRKPNTLSIRVPRKLHELIKAGAAHEGKSQSNFMVDATLELIAKLNQSSEISALLLPEDFAIPKSGSKMVTIRIAAEAADIIDRWAPRLYHPTTRLVLWASAAEAYRAADRAAENDQQKPE